VSDAAFYQALSEAGQLLVLRRLLRRQLRALKIEFVGKIIERFDGFYLIRQECQFTAFLSIKSRTLPIRK